jgi:hypothetical protein
VNFAGWNFAWLPLLVGDRGNGMELCVVAVACLLGLPLLVGDLGNGMKFRRLLCSIIFNA